MKYLISILGAVFVVGLAYIMMNDLLNQVNTAINNLMNGLW